MNCIIIEDEIPAQRVLKNYISKLSELELLGSFQSVFEANPFIQKNKIDLIFLDINLPEISGLQYIKTLIDPPTIIMTTAYHEHAVASFELDTICDYLVKPFSLERFLKAVNKAKKQFPIAIKEREGKNFNTDEYVFLSIDKTLHKLRLADIIYIESDKNYVNVITKSTRLTYIESLRNWLVKLPSNKFLQIHKSYIVNFDHIEKINGNRLSIHGEKIPIGRVYKSNLLKKINS